MRVHRDERRTFYGDIFSGQDGGDINVVYLAAHVPIAWHRHQRQTDRLFLIQGMLRVRVLRAEGQGWTEHILHPEEDRYVLQIPPNRWHGYEALTKDTIVLQCNGPGKWTGEDEERKSLEEIPWTPTQ